MDLCTRKSIITEFRQNVALEIKCNTNLKASRHKMKQPRPLKSQNLMIISGQIR